MLLQSFYILEWSIYRRGCFIIDTNNYFMIPMHECTYSFICFLIAYVVFFYKLNSCFLSSEIC